MQKRENMNAFSTDDSRKKCMPLISDHQLVSEKQRPYMKAMKILFEVDTLIGIILPFGICSTEDDCLCAKSCYKASLQINKK